MKKSHNVAQSNFAIIITLFLPLKKLAQLLVLCTTVIFTKTTQSKQSFNRRIVQSVHPEFKKVRRQDPYTKICRDLQHCKFTVNNSEQEL
jgi:hypothetical protein